MERDDIIAAIRRAAGQLGKTPTRGDLPLCALCGEKRRKTRPSRHGPSLNLSPSA